MAKSAPGSQLQSSTSRLSRPGESASIWLPLYILSRSGAIYTKVKFQKLVFLVQFAARLDLYDFKKHYYGPYSHVLNLETMYSPDLITPHINPSTSSSTGSYYSFEITPLGAKQLAKVLERIDAQTVKRIDAALDRYGNLSPHTLLDEVYKEFAVRKEDSIKMEERVRADCRETVSVLNDLFERYQNRQSLFLAATLQSVDKILSTMKTDDTVHRGVVFKLADEIVHKCQGVAGDLNQVPDSEAIRPSFIEIAELEDYLIDYCVSKKLNSAAMVPSLEGLLTEGDARRLQRVLKSLPLT